MHSILRKVAFAATASTLLAGAALADRSDWPSEITVGTASQGGAYFVYGNGLANFIGEELGIGASGEVTGGPVQNVTLVQLGDHDLGLITMGPAFTALQGESELAPGLEHTEIRALFPMYQTPFQVVTLSRSGLETVSDLDGRRVNVGPAGGTPGTYWPQFLNTLGVNASVSNAGASDAAGQLGDGLIDAFAFAAGIPTAAFSQLAAEGNVNIFGFTEDELSTILDNHPEVAHFVMEAGTYSGQDEDIDSVAMWNFAVAHEDMPESLAYEITKLVMENNDRMMQIHSAARETLKEHVDKNGFLPFHPGAVRYFEEQGIEIPDDLRG
ncbi:MAG: TAXI family TRAP transporter solute-binding subunit [Natronospirillum sp.]|uniref:TAXI family TRAP transporter solute-binding subunit n=1 Tax=Natronospirillum sp. TaxID=2812955 RepID=UPI002600866B|nr:TAXI family TRAP transporter solute-binding subunit [Natronospirillum sp.]MCH8551166.1 TAXI family TRAP transporter solute-binding subunit [Natronospirillum sp.]